MDRLETRMLMRYLFDIGKYILRWLVAFPFLILIMAYALLVALLDWLFDE